jgi:hypothetical protein
VAEQLAVEGSERLVGAARGSERRLEPRRGGVERYVPVDEVRRGQA